MSAHRTGLALVSLTFVAATLAPFGTAEARAVPTCDGRPATIVGTSGDDHLHGTPGDDVIVGLGGNDRIRGGAGDDVLCGGGGDDRLVGDRGDDTMLGQAGADVLDDERPGVSVMKGGPGNDFLTAEAGDGGRFDGGLGNDSYFIVSDHAHLNGGPGDDELELVTPFWNDMSLAGGDGHDLLLLDLRRHSDSGPGLRVLTADLATGRLTANRTSVPLTSVEDLVLSDENANSHDPGASLARKMVIRGDAGPNELSAGIDGPNGEPAWIYGRGGADVLQGGSGPDHLFGGQGHDRGFGGPRRDVCVSVEEPHHCEVTDQPTAR